MPKPKPTAAATPTAAPEAANERPIYQVENAKILEVSELVNVMNDTQNIAADQRDRIQFITDQTFETIDRKTQQPSETNAFSLKAREVVKQLAAKVKPIALAKIKALGKPVNPQIIALALTDATITFKREFRKGGEDLDYQGKPYAQDHWHTEIIQVTPNIDPLFMQEILQLIATQPAAPTATLTPSANSFVAAAGI